MKFNFIVPKHGTIKCTIQKSGKLGFTRAAIKELGINDNSYVKFGTNAEDKSDEDLYLLVKQEQDRESFKVNRAGDYYYVNTKQMFNDLGIDYVKEKVIYDIGKVIDNGNTYYRLKRRIKDRKNLI